MSKVERHRVLLALMTLAVAAVITGGTLRAQAVAIGEIAGRVTDSSGAPVAGVKVTIIETEKDQVRNVMSDGEGRYAFPSLPVGPYKLEAQSTGFKTFNQVGILLQVGNTIEINVELQVGSVNESIEVTGSGAMVETRENAISQVIDERRIVDLPLNGRQPTQLIVLSGAAVNAPGGGMTGSKKLRKFHDDFGGGRASERRQLSAGWRRSQ